MYSEPLNGYQPSVVTAVVKRCGLCVKINKCILTTFLNGIQIRIIILNTYLYETINLTHSTFFNRNSII